MKDFQSAKKEREEASKWLLSNLQSSGLASPFLIVIAQQIAGCLFTAEAIKNERVKYSSWLHKQCHHTLLVLCDFLWRRMPAAEYAKKMPSPLALVQVMCVCLSVCLVLSVCLSVCLSICLSVCLSVKIHIRVHLHVSTLTHASTSTCMNTWAHAVSHAYAHTHQRVYT